MGVRTNILSNQTLVHEFVEHLKFKNFRNLRIAYVGKFSPGGYSKGYEDLINLSHKFKDSDYYNEITIVGADKNEMIGLNKNRLKSNVNSDKLKFVKHLSHTEALRIMKSFDVLVLPAPLNSKYIGMPIKLLEYLAVGRVTVIANCDLFNSFFDSSFKPYSYEASNPVSLNEAIIKAVNDPALEARINSGVDYASKFTWEERTIKIMTYLREADS
jgi:glycosyltransferase involved in cell wall biosynthesis